MDTDNLTDELGEFLASRERENAYRVDETLKYSPTETTEIVYFIGLNGSELGPFIRKEIKLSAGIGMAYDALWRAQRIGKRLSHVPRLVECRAVGDRLTVVMEYVEGATIASLVERVGASVALALLVMPAVCDAVIEFHEAFDSPLVHRDLKPSNVILTGNVASLLSDVLRTGNSGSASGDIEAVIIDFGIARTYRAGAEADTTHFGTRGYAAPEQFGFGQTDIRSDVYALGMLAAFCCTGVQPSGALDARTLQSCGTPEPLVRVIAKAASFDPGDRFATVREFKAAWTAAADEVFAEKAPLESGRITATEGGNKRAQTRVHRSRRPDSGRFVYLGRIWNTVLLFMLLVLYAAYAYAVATPTGAIAREPTWYLVAVVLLLFVPETALIAALIADRRRWPDRLPLIGEPAFGRLCRALLIMLVGGFAALVVITAFKDA